MQLENCFNDKNCYNGTQAEIYPYTRKETVVINVNPFGNLAYYMVPRGLKKYKDPRTGIIFKLKNECNLKKLG